MKSSGVKNFIFKFIALFLMSVFAVSFIFIFVWMLCNSFRTAAQFSFEPFAIFDFSEFTFENYAQAFAYEVGSRQSGYVNMFGMFLNSLKLIVINVVLSLIFPPLVGYITAKFDFKLKKLVMLLVIAAMSIPAIGATTSTYKFINDIGLWNSWFGVILLGSSSLGFGVLLYGNYFASIPWDFAEAAYMDGAGELTIYLKIMLPQALPIMMSMMIMTIIGSWNDYMTNYLYLPAHPTVAYGVNSIYTQFVKNGNNYPVAFAVMVFTSGIVLVIYAFFSKTIMSSLSAGGIKG